MSHNYSECFKHISQASDRECQRREREHLQAAVNAAVDAAEVLKTALFELGQVTGDNPLDWRFKFEYLRGFPLETPATREILNLLIKDLEGVEDE